MNGLVWPAAAAVVLICLTVADTRRRRKTADPLVVALEEVLGAGSVKQIKPTRRPWRHLRTISLTSPPEE